MTAAELKAFRDERHLSLEDVSLRVGISRRTLSRWEKGELPIPQNFSLPETLACGYNGHVDKQRLNEENAQSTQELAPDIEIVPYSAPPLPDRPLPLFGNGHATPSPPVDDPPPGYEEITPEFLQLTLIEARLAQIEKALKRLEHPAVVVDPERVTRKEMYEAIQEITDRAIFKYTEKLRAACAADLQAEIAPLRKALGLPSHPKVTTVQSEPLI